MPTLLRDAGMALHENAGGSEAFGHLIALVDGQIAVVDLERHDRHAGDVEASPHVHAVTLVGSPAPGGFASFGLSADQLVAIDLVPAHPSFAAPVMHRLGGVVVVVDVVGIGASVRELLQPTKQTRKPRQPAEV